MQITITGRNVEITPAIRKYAEEKLGKMQRYLDNITDAHIVLSLQKYLHIAEVTLRVEGLTIRAEERSPDMYSSLDLVVDKIEGQLRRYKEKIVTHGTRRYSRQTGSDRSVGSGEEEEGLEGKIIRTKRFPMKPQFTDEAIMQMEMLGHSFYVFRNADTEEINVIYRRRDGNYGIITPEEGS